MSNEDRIKEIELQIEKLKREKNILKGTLTIGHEVKNDIATGRYGEVVMRRPTYVPETWGHILSLAKELHRFGRGKRNLRPPRIAVKDLTPEEIACSASLAEDLIEVWNRHFLELYKDDVTDKTKHGGGL